MKLEKVLVFSHFSVCIYEMRIESPYVVAQINVLIRLHNGRYQSRQLI